MHLPMRILGHAPYLPSPAASSRQNNPESTPATPRVVNEAAPASASTTSPGTMLIPVASLSSLPTNASLNQRKAVQAYQSVQRLAQSSVEVMGLDASA